MDNDILKLLPKKAFDLISLSDTLKIGKQLTQSLINKNAYQASVSDRVKSLCLSDLIIVDEILANSQRPNTKIDGEKILSIYFLQFFDGHQNVHLDFRMQHFARHDQFQWMPSKLYHSFSHDFKMGVKALYIGFYLDDQQKFEEGLSLLGIIQAKMNDEKKQAVVKIFLEHFGEGKTGPVNFSLKKLQESFNKIFAHFLKEDIPLNPEFALLGAMLVTLYVTLEKIPHSLNVHNAFIEVFEKYK